VLDRLKKGLDHDTYEKVLELIAAEDTPGAPGGEDSTLSS
jgi:hypothetical protein